MTIYEKTPGGLIATGERTVSTFASGLCMISQNYICRSDTAATHRETLAIGNELPDDDGSPATDGAYIFPAAQEVKRSDGFTEFQVSAYGRTFSGASITNAFPRRVTCTSTVSCSIFHFSGSIVVPRFDSVSAAELMLGNEFKAPFDFIWKIHPDYVTSSVTIIDSVAARSQAVVIGVSQTAGGRLGVVSATQDVPAKTKYEVAFNQGGVPVAPVLRVWINSSVIIEKTRRNFGEWAEVEFETKSEAIETVIV